MSFEKKATPKVEIDPKIEEAVRAKADQIADFFRKKLNDWANRQDLKEAVRRTKSINDTTNAIFFGHLTKDDFMRLNKKGSLIGQYVSAVGKVLNEKKQEKAKNVIEKQLDFFKN